MTSRLTGDTLLWGQSLAWGTKKMTGPLPLEVAHLSCCTSPHHYLFLDSHKDCLTIPWISAVSVISIPMINGCYSLGHMSASHLTPRPSVSGVSLAIFPPSPPSTANDGDCGKSPVHHLDTNVFELVEAQHDSSIDRIGQTTY